MQGSIRLIPRMSLGFSCFLSYKATFFFLSVFFLTKYCLVIDMRSKNLVKLKKTLPQKSKAQVVTTTSKKMKFIDVGLGEDPAKRDFEVSIEAILMTAIQPSLLILALI